MRCRRCINADMAAAAGGRLLLRIEDIDEARCRPEYEAAIYEDLAWLGLALGAAGAAAVRALRRLPRSAREARRAGPGLSELREPRRDRGAGGGARSKSPWPRDPDGAPLYPGNAKAMAAGRARRAACAPASLTRCASTWQAALARAGTLTWSESGAGPAGETGTVAADPAAWGDVILARKDTPTSYHLAVVVDDAAQGVTDVVRGRDLFHATGVHRLLQALLGLAAPRYHHHRLILDADGKQAVEIDRRHGFARIARARRQPGRDPPAGRARLSVLALSAVGGAMAKQRRKATPQAQARKPRKPRAPKRAARERCRRRARSRPRSPASPTTSARRSPASWRSPNCWPRPTSAARAGMGERRQERRRASRRALLADRRRRQGGSRRPHAAPRAVLAARAGRGGRRRRSPRAPATRTSRPTFAIARELPAHGRRRRRATARGAGESRRQRGEIHRRRRRDLHGRTPSRPRAAACGSSSR